MDESLSIFIDAWIEDTTDPMFNKIRAVLKDTLTQEINQHIQGERPFEKLSQAGQTIVMQWEDYNKQRKENSPC